MKIFQMNKKNVSLLVIISFSCLMFYQCKSKSEETAVKEEKIELNSDVEKEKIVGTKYLITSALHHKEHLMHMNLREALAFVADLAPERAWLTHVSHQMGLASKIGPQLPPGVALAYDGLEIEF